MSILDTHGRDPNMHATTKQDHNPHSAGSSFDTPYLVTLFATETVWNQIWQMFMVTKWVVDYRLWRINKHEAYRIMSKASKTSLECQGSISVKTFQDLFGMSENGTNTFFSLLQLRLFLIVPTHTSANASYRTGPPHYNASAKLSTLRLCFTRSINDHRRRKFWPDYMLQSARYPKSHYKISALYWRGPVYSSILDITGLHQKHQHNRHLHNIFQLRVFFSDIAGQFHHKKWQLPLLRQSVFLSCTVFFYHAQCNTITTPMTNCLSKCSGMQL